MPKQLSPGKILEARLLDNLRVVARGLTPEGRPRPVIQGVTHFGTFVGGLTLGGCLAQARQILLDSGRVYRWGTAIFLEFDAAGDRQLLLLADEDLGGQLPVIRHYARRPIYDEDFRLCGPGWHPESGVLVHAPDITPYLEAPPSAASAAALDRLPPHLGRLLRDFCWASDADLVNALAAVLTGFLSNHFVDDGKPIVLLDGNQRGLGKTLFAGVVGRVLDGVEPRRLPLVRDEELGRILSAALRESASSLLFFDNIRGRIDSPLLEANALSPVLSFRILGVSSNITRPNTYLWVITSNSTSGTEDFVSRALPIRFRFEGNPRERTFSGDPAGYATRHRLEILGELAGMVERWKQAGSPPGVRPHRCARWAQQIGGILGVAGLDQFLGNLEEVEANMDEGLQALVDLAEHVMSRKRTPCYAVGAGPVDKEVGVLPRDWVGEALGAGVITDVLQGKNPKGQATWMGTFLSGKTCREVEISTPEGPATARLIKVVGRGNQSRYFFQICCKDGDAPPPEAANVPVTAPAISPPVHPEINGNGNSGNGVEPGEDAPPTEVLTPGEQGNDLDWI